MLLTAVPCQRLNVCAVLAGSSAYRVDNTGVGVGRGNAIIDPNPVGYCSPGYTTCVTRQLRRRKPRRSVFVRMACLISLLPPLGQCRALLRQAIDSLHIVASTSAQGPHGSLGGSR